MKHIDYYLKYIKPIEKKYTKMCIFYSYTKMKYFENQKNFYNNILNYYYHSLLNNPSKLKELENNLL